MRILNECPFKESILEAHLNIQAITYLEQQTIKSISGF